MKMDNSREKIETLLKYYESARQEVLARISSRDNSILLYLAAIGAIVAAVMQSNNTSYLLVLPFLSVGIAPIIAQHHAIIGGISLYCSVELRPFFLNLGVDIPSWDNSWSRMSFVNTTIQLRYLGDTIMICLLPSIGLVINFSNLKDGWMVLLFGLGVVSTLVSLFIMIKTYKIRQKHFQKMKNDGISNKE
jgi:hypothetical protein